MDIQNCKRESSTPKEENKEENAGAHGPGNTSKQEKKKQNESNKEQTRTPIEPNSIPEQSKANQQAES